MALATSANGLSTLVSDRRPPARGSTAASTALLQWEIDTPLIRLAEGIGFERARAAWQRSFKAVQALGAVDVAGVVSSYPASHGVTSVHAGAFTVVL